jgi:hypothetical protein
VACQGTVEKHVMIRRNFEGFEEIFESLYSIIVHPRAFPDKIIENVINVCVAAFFDP